jgi:hypothetical protein
MTPRGNPENEAEMNGKAEWLKKVKLFNPMIFSRVGSLAKVQK